MKVSRINSLTEFIDQVVSLRPEMEEGTLLHKELVFRGLSSCNYSLAPSLGRRPSKGWLNTLAFVERDLISEAQTKYPDIFRNNDLPIIKLAKLQHFGIPTRMMDVTSNALVALYFACQKSENHSTDDGEIVAFSGFPVPAITATANIIADTYRLTENALTDLETYYYRGVKQDYAVRLQYPNWEIEHKNAIVSFRNSISQPTIVHSFESSTRQKNQQGKYILFPNRISGPDEDGEIVVLNELVTLTKEDPLILKRFIIPASAKDEILCQLPILGISKEVLFADNVDVVFSAVKERQEARYK